MRPALPFKVTSEGIGNRRSIKKLNSSGIFFLWRPNLPLSQVDIHHPFLDKPEVISIIRNSKESTPRGRGFIWSPSKGAERVPSGPGVDGVVEWWRTGVVEDWSGGVMEYWSDGIELKEGF
jgi:hypothetical protein